MFRERTSLYLTLIAVALFSFFLAAPAARAQTVSDSDITVSVSPQIPGPLTDVTITLSSLSVDLNVANIAWTSGGSTVLSGLGRKTYSFRTGVIGTTTTISASVDIAGTPTITKRITITPLEVDLLWEATDAYVPPFYKGKALFASEGAVKVVAIPNIRSASGAHLKPGDFTYNWKRNYTSETGQSGYGKNAFIFRHSYLNPEEKIAVSIASTTGGQQASKSLAISATTPKIIFYENDLETGIEYGKALADDYLQIDRAGASIIAEPYFFSPKNLGSDLSFDWTINNRQTQTSGAKNTFSIQPQGSGAAELGLSVTSRSKIFQSARKSLFLNLIAQ